MYTGQIFRNYFRRRSLQKEARTSHTERPPVIVLIDVVSKCVSRECPYHWSKTRQYEWNCIFWKDLCRGSNNSSTFSVTGLACHYRFHKLWCPWSDDGSNTGGILGPAVLVSPERRWHVLADADIAKSSAVQTESRCPRSVTFKRPDFKKMQVRGVPLAEMMQRPPSSHGAQVWHIRPSSQSACGKGRRSEANLHRVSLSSSKHFLYFSLMRCVARKKEREKKKHACMWTRTCRIKREACLNMSHEKKKRVKFLWICADIIYPKISDMMKN